MFQRIRKMKSVGCENKPLFAENAVHKFYCIKLISCLQSAELICTSSKEIVLCLAVLHSKAEYLQFVLRC